MEGFRRNKRGFLTKFDNILTLALPVREGKGEDSYYCCGPDEDTERAVAGVFDGSGGLGTRMHKEAGGYTEAYLGSRALSGALCSWHHHYRNTTFSSGKEIVESLNAYFMKAFGVLTANTVENTKIKGALIRSFPSTAALFIADNDPSGIRIHVIWVGDSRVYLLNEEGLAQITMDDVETVDALENLSSDGVMKNVMAADGNYEIHYRNIVIEDPALVFAASDGCYGYIPTPMEFEYEILDALCNAPTPLDFRDRLTRLFKDVAGDDSTMCIMSFLFGTFKEQKKRLQSRLDILEQEYIQPIFNYREEHPGQDQEFVRRVWNRYRIGYERYQHEPV